MKFADGVPEIENVATDEFEYPPLALVALVRLIPCATVSPCLWLVEVKDVVGVLLMCVGKW